MASERRLIDVNDFLAKLKERHENIMQDPEVSKRMKWCEAVHYGATTEIIEKMPTIEATPVVHGYWREYNRSALVSWKNGEPVWVDRAVYYCDGCSFGTIIKHNYCPRCGQKMDGGVSDG